MCASDSCQKRILGLDEVDSPQRVAYEHARSHHEEHDSGVLVRDFVPCVKVEGGAETVGLYDVSRNATKRFYENGGSGALVAGPELPELPSGFVFFLR